MHVQAMTSSSNYNTNWSHITLGELLAPWMTKAFELYQYHTCSQVYGGCMSHDLQLNLPSPISSLCIQFPLQPALCFFPSFFLFHFLLLVLELFPSTAFYRECLWFLKLSASMLNVLFKYYNIYFIKKYIIYYNIIPNK